MDGARYSRFPNFSWLCFRVTGNARQTPYVVDMESRTHVISLTVTGDHSVRWIRGGRETRWEETAGTINYTPRDDDHHTFVTQMSPDCESAVLLIPHGHLRSCLADEGHEPAVEFHHLLTRADPVLESCMRRLTAIARPDDDAAGARLDEASRRLVLRLVELSGGRRPDWHADESTFDRATITHLVNYIDEHLQVTPSLAALAMLTGLSPSHFAKKFRHSTGLSPHRFVNRRRVARSLALLRGDSHSLADVALELGFSSQSHFTRLFSLLSGMTPARYRKQCCRSVG